MTKDQLLNEGVLAKFLRYVQVDSPSQDGTGQTPSTPEQWTVARLLCDELLTLGLSDAQVDENGFVTATVPGNRENCPVVGFLAHMDTVPGVPGHGVKPIVHENYPGGDIVLPSGAVLSPNDCAALNKTIGHAIVTSDGHTLLGADDKAGVAEIMEAVCHMLKHPEFEHGTVKVGFTPDEEIGSGIGKFKVDAFGADLGYTLDGGIYGELGDENFNAANYRVVITGRSSHTGTARNAMINAVHLAGQLVGAIPANMRPETTDGYLGFIHPDAIQGNIECVTMKVLVRDFTDEGLQQKQQILHRICEDLALRYPGAEVNIEQTGGYRNMQGVLKDKPQIVQLAQEAIRMTGTTPAMRQARGGTDGARLTYVGLPCPNLFYGGANAHSRLEWASVEWMRKAVEMVLNLCHLWAEQTK
jgi:tripeptide aminopeptidase